MTYAYDAAGQVSGVDLTVAGTTQSLATGLAHAPFGPLTALTYGNDLTLTQSFDTAYRMTGQTIPGVLALAYPQYDANGNLAARDDALVGQPETYAYDALDRLDAATGPFGSRGYAYDKNGNRTALGGTAYTYTPNSNRLTAIGSADVLLDANGNTLNKGAWTFDYSTHNRLTAAYDDGMLAATYAYNGLGQRIRKTLSDGRGRHFLYGVDGELLAETDGDGNILTEYVYLNGQLLAVYQPDDDQDGLSNAEEDNLDTNPANTDRDGDGLRDLDEWYQAGTDARLADTDGDGVLDGAEYAAGTDPLSGASYPGDGDVNADGEINAGDLVLVMQMAFGQRTPTAAQLVRADINRDGVVDVVDVMLLQRRILGYISWRVIGDWPGVQNLLAGVERAGGLLSSAREQIYTAFIGTAHADVANGKLYYVHNDHLGTPKVMTNEAGAVVWSAVHDPFGLATINPGSTVEMNVRFPGQYYDAETGLHYNYFRTYDPETGRYLESDPIGLDGGLNTYAYGLSNPLTFFDPDGLEVRFMCRFVDIEFARKRKLKHCFVYVTCPEEGWSVVLSLFGHPETGFRTGSKAMQAPGGPGWEEWPDNPYNPDLTDNVLTWPNKPGCGTCEYEKRVLETYRNFPDGPVPYRMYGPNSNRFAQDLIHRSGGTAGGHPIFGAPGMR